MKSDHIVLALLWSAYCAVHSALISTGTVNFLKRTLGTRYSYYRLFFNAFSLVTLAPLVLYSYSPRHQDPILFDWSGAWSIPRFLLVILAATLLIGGARHYSLGRFLGLRQIRSKHGRGALTESGDLDTTGVLGVVRHPWYVAVFLLLWANDLNIARVIVNSILSAYLVIGTLLEERKLVLEFGERYREYQRNVSMFIPLKWLHSGQK